MLDLALLLCTCLGILTLIFLSDSEAQVKIQNSNVDGSEDHKMKFQGQPRGRPV